MDDLRLASIIDDDDDLLLLSCLPSSSRYSNSRMNISEFSDEQFRTQFRFEKDDIVPLCTALKLPEKLICANGTALTGLEGLCITLRRLSYPNRFDDLIPIFNRSKSELSYISNRIFDFLYDEHSHRLHSLNQSFLRPQLLRVYADAISDIGAPLENCWGFIDGTIRPICRPSENQQIVYSGHKRTHGLKFQSVVIPNGIVANLFGPMEARRHDAAMLRESGLLPLLERHMTMPDGTIYSLYGDPAYPISPHLIAPFRGGVITANEHIFNKRMSKLRSSVEWTFGKVISTFAFVDYKKNQKLYLQPVGKYYAVATLLTNCHTCLYGSATSEYFNLNPPSLQEYLS